MVCSRLDVQTRRTKNGRPLLFWRITQQWLCNLRHVRARYCANFCSYSCAISLLWHSDYCHHDPKRTFQCSCMASQALVHSGTGTLWHLLPSPGFGLHLPSTLHYFLGWQFKRPSCHRLPTCRVGAPSCAGCISWFCLPTHSWSYYQLVYAQSPASKLETRQARTPLQARANTSACFSYYVWLAR